MTFLIRIAAFGALTRSCRAVFLALGLVAASGHAQPLAQGAARETVVIADSAYELHTYKPAGYANGPLLLVLHGVGRNAAGYRDHARALADRYGLLVVAPLFDRSRFPVWRYQLGGLARGAAGAEAAALEPVAERLGTVLEALVAEVRRRENRPDLPYVLIGHSGGGQALTRVAATADVTATTATTIAPLGYIIANPSTYLWPDRSRHHPYGLGGLPPPLGDEAALRRYLAQPLVVLLGTADTRHDRDLNVGSEAMRQGEHRYARGLAFFHAGASAARDRGWAFGWRLVEVPDVGHSARQMFGHPATHEALGVLLAAGDAGASPP